jgi:hypothetical protein
VTAALALWEEEYKDWYWLRAVLWAEVEADSVSMAWARERARTLRWVRE